MLKGASVNDFNGGICTYDYRSNQKFLFFFLGRTLSVLSSTQLQIDPDLSIGHDLRRWYLEEGMNIEMIDLTIQLNNHENSNKKKSFQTFS
jgi:hypothetical protein